MDEDVAAFVDRVPEEYVVVDESALDGRVVGLDDGGADGDPTEGDADPTVADGDPTDRARALVAGGPDIDAPAEIELLTPVVPDALTDALQATVLDGETPFSVVATGDAAGLLEEGVLATALPLLSGRDDVSVAVHGGDAPFAVLVRPDVVGFALVGEDGEIDCVFESDGEEARTWARAVVDGYRNESEEVV